MGRFIADALRAAGVRYAFTVPGESFLGLLDGWPVDLRRLVTAERRVAFGKTVRALLAENGATR